MGNVGSGRGLKALGAGICHIAASHLIQDDEKEYNFQFASDQIEGEMPAFVNFCRREQGLVVAGGNPKKINEFKDLGREDVMVANRPEGTGTRLLFDREIQKVGLNGSDIRGYDREFRSHMDVAIEVLSGRVDAGLAVRPVAALLGLEFIPIRWERFDLLIPKDRFFEKGVQLFLGLLHERGFREVANQLEGYDLSISGKMVFPMQSKEKKEE